MTLTTIRRLRRTQSGVLINPPDEHLKLLGWNDVRKVIIITDNETQTITIKKYEE